MADPFPTKAAPKSARVLFRGVEFKITVSDSEHDGHINVVLEADKPPRGLDTKLYDLTLRPVE